MKCECKICICEESLPKFGILFDLNIFKVKKVSEIFIAFKYWQIQIQTFLVEMIFAQSLKNYHKLNLKEFETTKTNKQTKHEICGNKRQNEQEPGITEENRKRKMRKISDIRMITR